MNSSILVVNTPADTYDLTALNTIKDELNITGTGSDDQLRRYISRISDEIADHCRRVFPVETVTETWRRERNHLYFRSIEPDPLMLNRVPISVINSITADEQTLVEADDYEVDYASGLIWRLGANNRRTHWTALTLVVNYAGGYELLDGLPQAVESACIAMIKERWFARGRDQALKQINIPGVVEKQYWIGALSDPAIPGYIADKLAPYRRPLV